MFNHIKALIGFKYVSIFCSLILIYQPVVFALPQGEQIEAGSAEFARSEDGTTLNITASNGSIIHYDSFNIAQNETVNFLLPGVDAFSLNRILGSEGTSILGSLYSNGNLILVNSSGFYFGSTAVVNAGGLIASTLDIQNADFLAGHYLFSGVDLSTHASILNEGIISVEDGGMAILVADAIDNRGSILAPLGTVSLAAGEMVTIGISQNGLVSVAIDRETAEQILDKDGNAILDQINNTGELSAENGRVLLNASAADLIFDRSINLEGYVNANGVSQDSAGGVYLTADDDIHLGSYIESNFGSVQISSGKNIDITRSDVDSAYLFLGANEDINIDGYIHSSADTFLTALGDINMDIPLDVDKVLTIYDGHLDLSRNPYDIYVGGLNLDGNTTITPGTGAWAFTGPGVGGLSLHSNMNIGAVAVGDGISPKMLFLQSDATFDALYINDNSFIDLNGHDFSFSSPQAAVNYGSIYLYGTETLHNVLNLGIDFGRVYYTDPDFDHLSENGYTIHDFGPGVDYYQLDLGNPGNVGVMAETYKIENDLHVATDFFIGNATYNANGHETVVDGVTALSGADSTYNAGSADQHLNDGLQLFNGATFNGSTGTVHVGEFLTISTDANFNAPDNLDLKVYYFSVFPGGAFNAGTGTVNFNAPEGPSFWRGQNYSVVRFFDDTTTFHNFNVNLGDGRTMIMAFDRALNVSNDLRLMDGRVSGGILQANAPMNVMGDVVVGPDFDSGLSPLVFTGDRAHQSFDLTGGESNFLGDVVINKTEGNVDLLSDLYVDNFHQDIDIESGTLNANHHDIHLYGNWINQGSFEATDATVYLDGYDQGIYGETTFHNLTKVGEEEGLYFESGKLQTITGTLRLEGSADGLLYLDTSDEGQALIDPQGERVVSYLNVHNNENVNAQDIPCLDNCVDGEGNVQWVFELGNPPAPDPDPIPELTPDPGPTPDPTPDPEPGDHDNGHGNDDDHDDDSNPGNGGGNHSSNENNDGNLGNNDQPGNENLETTDDSNSSESPEAPEVPEESNENVESEQLVQEEPALDPEPEPEPEPELSELPEENSNENEHGNGQGHEVLSEEPDHGPTEHANQNAEMHSDELENVESEDLPVIEEETLENLQTTGLSQNFREEAPLNDSEVIQPLFEEPLQVGDRQESLVERVTTLTQEFFALKTFEPAAQFFQNLATHFSPDNNGASHDLSASRANSANDNAPQSLGNDAIGNNSFSLIQIVESTQVAAAPIATEAPKLGETSRASDSHNDSEINKTDGEGKASDSEQEEKRK